MALNCAHQIASLVVCHFATDDQKLFTENGTWRLNAQFRCVANHLKPSAPNYKLSCQICKDLTLDTKSSQSFMVDYCSGVLEWLEN